MMTSERENPWHTGKCYQFQVDGRAAAPIRDKWEDAAQDAVSAGMATQSGYADGRIYLDDQAEIARLPAPPLPDRSK